MSLLLVNLCFSSLKQRFFLFSCITFSGNEIFIGANNNAISKGDIAMLELYYSETCPYCRRVIEYLRENDIDFSPKDVSIPQYYDELVELGKIAQVPFLVDTDNNIKMYESDSIISYVKNLCK